MNIVKELRKKQNIQQKELALIIGVAQPTVSEDREKNERQKIESGLFRVQNGVQIESEEAETIEK